MNLKTTLIILIILAIISAGLFYFFVFNKAVRPPLGSRTAQQSEAYLQKQLSEVVENKDFSKCDEITDDFYKKVCINNVAVELSKESLDIAYCERVDGELISKSYCQEQVLLLKFEKEETGDFCKKLQSTNEQEDCLINFYNRLALRKDNAEICQSITETEQVDFCHDNYIVSKSFAQNPEKFNCLFLKNIDARSDCESMKPVILNSDPTLPSKMNEKCLLLKTRIFTPYCL